MRVIKAGKVLEDNWQRLTAVEQQQSLPDGDWIIPLDYWCDNREMLSRHKGRIAVCLNGDDNLEDFSDSLELFDLIALEFPKFTDGRCYSHARLLRDRFGFQGEIRAVGDVLRDQLFFMQRCGIDSFQLREDKNPEDALQGLSDFTVKYQTAADGALPVYKHRQRGPE